MLCKIKKSLLQVHVPEILLISYTPTPSQIIIRNNFYVNNKYGILKSKRILNFLWNERRESHTKPYHVLVSVLVPVPYGTVPYRRWNNLFSSFTHQQWQQQGWWWSILWYNENLGMIGTNKYFLNLLSTVHQLNHLSVTINTKMFQYFC